ncbi:hypothetical protein F8388_022437, partial [Cannabis sativa]
RLSSNVKIIGKIQVKGNKENNRNCGGISYLTQEDVFLGTLTVRETITYSAHLRVSNKMSKEEIENLVQKTIEEMGLEHCADNKIGNWYFRGISGGEKKRLRIGLEILTQPQIMLLDEPTTGLDSASAFFVVCTLKNIAHNGRIVVCSIHQPSGYLFDLFDDLYLLSGGEAVYFGDAKSAVKFFADAGFPCPTKTNPTDHFLRCVNSDFDNVSTSSFLRSNKTSITEESIISINYGSTSLTNMTTQDMKEILIHQYNNSEYATLTRHNIQQINSFIFQIKNPIFKLYPKPQAQIQPTYFFYERLLWSNQVILTLCFMLFVQKEVIVLSNKSKSSWWKQLYTLTDRSFVNMRRDVGYYWLRMVFYLGVAVCTGTIYYNIKTSYLDIIARANERIKNHYGAAVVMISNFISSFPFLLVTAISTGTIIYEMVKLHPGFSHYFYFVLNLFCCLSVIETLMMLVASLVPNVLMGIGIGTGLIVFMMMASEIFRPMSDIPKFFWRYPMSYISFASWALQGVYKNDMIGIEFDPLVAGYPKLKGEIILQTMFGMPLDHSKWWDLAALVCLLISHRLIFFLILKYKDTISLHSKLYFDTVVHQIGNLSRSSSSSLSQSFNVISKKKISTSKTLHSLSSQLDLSSPMRPS